MSTLLSISNALLWVFMIFQFICFIMLAKLVANFLNRFRISNTSVAPVKLHVGVQAPLFRETDQNGQIVALSETEGKPTLLLFTDDSCSICKQLIPTLPTLKEHTDIRIIVIAHERKDAQIKDIPDGVHFLRSDQIIEDYLFPGAPAMILVDHKRYIISNEIVNSSHQLEVFLRHSLKSTNS